MLRIPAVRLLGGGLDVKRPAFQFYPADWRKDAALQSCSMAAQGLWINVMCIAHECEPYGHLTINGQPMTTPQLSRLVGMSVKECGPLLTELINAGVADESLQGLSSRRMVRDEALRNMRAACGRLGGNPLLLENKVNPKPTPSSSSSSSIKEKKPAAPSLTVEELMAEGLAEETAAEFLVLRQRKGARLTRRAWAGIAEEIKKSGWTADRAITKALSRGWVAFEADWIKDEKTRKADVAAVTVPGPAPSSYLAEQAEHKRLADAERAARKQREAA